MYSTVDLVTDSSNQAMKTIYLDDIKKAFSHLKIYENFKVGGYQTDLYIEDYDLVVEFDQKNNTREEFIKSELQCNLIKFDSTATNFSIFNVIAEVHKYIVNKILIDYDYLLAKRNHTIKILRHQFST
jgi:hypothetical protein